MADQNIDIKINVDNSKATTGINSIGDALKNISSKVLPEATSAFTSLNAVMDANPIGAIVIAVTAAIAVFKEIGSVLMNNTQIFDEVNADLDGIKAAIEAIANFKNPFEAFTGARDAALEAQELGIQTSLAGIEIEDLNAQLIKQKEIYKDQTKTAKERQDAAQKTIDIQQKIGDLNTKTAKDELNNLVKKKSAFIDYNKFLKMSTKEQAELVSKNKDIQDTEVNTILDAIAKVQKVRNESEAATLKAHTFINAETAKEDAKAAAKKKKASEDYEKARKKKESDAKIAAKKAIKDAQIQAETLASLEEDGLQKRLDIQAAKFIEERQKLEEAGVTKSVIEEKYAKERLDITNKFNEEQQKIKDKADKDDADRLKKQVDGDKKASDEIIANRLKQVNLQKEYSKTQEQIDADYEQAVKDGVKDVYAYLANKYKEDVDAKKKAIKEKEEAEKTAFDIAKGLMDALNAISDLVAEMDSQRTYKSLAEKNAAAKKEFNLKKGLSIVSAAINTAQGITAAIGNPGGIAGFVLAGLAAATGAIQIATIAAKKFTPESPSSSGSAPSAPSGAASMSQLQSPSFFGLGSNNVMANQQGPGPIKVFVTENDITNSQHKVSVIQNRSVMGH